MFHNGPGIGLTQHHQSSNQCCARQRSALINVELSLLKRALQRCQKLECRFYNVIKVFNSMLQDSLCCIVWRLTLIDRCLKCISKTGTNRPWRIWRAETSNIGIVKFLKTSLNAMRALLWPITVLISKYTPIVSKENLHEEECPRSKTLVDFFGVVLK